MNDLGSITPIDTGFDVRAHDMPVALNLSPGEQYRMRYQVGTGIKGKSQIAEGTPEELCRVLLAAGYKVRAAETPNGRNINATPKGFEVQPRNDNYWITVPTLADAFAAFERPDNYRDR